MTSAERTRRLAESLGASRVVDLGHRSIGGPLDLLALRQEVGQRLRSTGGRPTDQSWKVTRQVPFSNESWNHLRLLAERIGQERPRVGPAQLAAILVEHGLEELEASRWGEVLDASRSRELVSATAAAEAAGISYRQLDAWCKAGLLRPARSAAGRRWFDDDELVRSIWLRSVHPSSDKSARADVLAAVGQAPLDARYLLVRDGRAVRTVHSRGLLLRVLEEPGTHEVIDQLPIRLRLLGWDQHDDERSAVNDEAAEAL